MKVVKQLALFVENKPGTLAAVCQALADKQINIEAISISDAVDGRERSAESVAFVGGAWGPCH